MDKDQHDDIGKWFKDKIEPMTQLPRPEIWESLENLLNKSDASTYKEKFITAKRVSVVLFLLLLSFATATFYFISVSKKDTNNNLLSRNQVSHPVKILKIHEGSSSTISLSSGNVKPIHQILENENSNVDTGAVNVMPTATIYNSAESITQQSGINLTEVIKPELIPGNTTEMKTLPLTDSKTLPSKKNTIKKLPANRFSISFFAAPELAGYILDNDGINPQADKQIIEERENHLLSFSGGILISRKLNERLSLQSGIIYSSSNISIDPSKIYAVKDDAGNIKYRYNTSSGFAYFLPSFSSSPFVGDSLNTTSSIHNLQYISIPLMVKFSFQKNKFGFNPAIGLAVNFLTKAKLETEIENSQGKETETATDLMGMCKTGFSLLLTSEFQCHLSKDLAFSVLPYFKYSLSAINKGYVIHTYPYNAGLGLGVTYKF